MSRKHRIKEPVDRALGVVKAFSLTVPGAVQVKLDIEAASGVADSGDPQQDLADLLGEIGEVAQSTRTGALFLVDEMHNLDTLARRDLYRPASDQPPQPAGRARRRRAPRPARSVSSRPSPTPIASVVAESAGYPYFIQEYGLELWNHAEDTPIDLADMDTVRDMAAAGDPPYRVGQDATHYGARDQRGVSVHRDALIQKGLVWSPRRGQVDLRSRSSPSTCERTTRSTVSTSGLLGPAHNPTADTAPHGMLRPVRSYIAHTESGSESGGGGIRTLGTT